MTYHDRRQDSYCRSGQYWVRDAIIVTLLISFVSYLRRERVLCHCCDAALTLARQTILSRRCL